eukprot:23171_1
MLHSFTNGYAHAQYKIKSTTCLIVVSLLLIFIFIMKLNHENDYVHSTQLRKLQSATSTTDEKDQEIGILKDPETMPPSQTSITSKITYAHRKRAYPETISPSPTEHPTTISPTKQPTRKPSRGPTYRFSDIQILQKQFDTGPIGARNTYYDHSQINGTIMELQWYLNSDLYDKNESINGSNSLLIINLFNNNLMKCWYSNKKGDSEPYNKIFCSITTRRNILFKQMINIRLNALKTHLKYVDGAA